MSEVQVSAYISEETKAMMEAHVNSRGLKKAFFIEEALRFHLHAANELPEDMMVSPDIRLSEASFSELVQALEQDDAPTQQLKDLWHG